MAVLTKGIYTSTIYNLHGAYNLNISVYRAILMYSNNQNRALADCTYFTYTLRMAESQHTQHASAVTIFIVTIIPQTAYGYTVGKGW